MNILVAKLGSLQPQIYIYLKNHYTTQALNYKMNNKKRLRVNICEVGKTNYVPQTFHDIYIKIKYYIKWFKSH
jgi:hypothetical protein